MNRWFVAFVFAMAIGCLVVPVSAQETKSEPAWCGGSWSPGSADETGKVVDRGGVSFAKCVPVTKKVGGKDVSVPTHPANPAKQVTFQPDGKGQLVGGTMQSKKFMAMPRVVAPKRK